jgi:hypothetical protein
MQTLSDNVPQHTPQPWRPPNASLFNEHRRTLEVGSGIAHDVLEESGAWSVAHGRELPKGFSRRQRQRGAGILFALHRPNGETSWSFRPDAPDPDSPGRKYEQPCKAYGGPGNVLYVHPSQRHLIADKLVPVVFVEGIKKALAIVTAARAAGAEVLVVAVLGVWNWLSDGRPIADMLGIPVDGREVSICFDSDVFRNPDVADAARRKAEHLIGRGATVRLAYLPDHADGSKTGADDFLARGNGYRELAATFRPFDAANLAGERLKRGYRLRAMLDDLRRTFWAAEWRGMGGHSSRDVFKVLADAAVDRGKLHEDGLRVKISRGELARLAKVSTRTLQKAVERLEDMGLLYRDNEARRPRERGAFVLRATVNHYEKCHGHRAETSDGETGVAVSSLHLRAPRLRWSSPAVKGRRGVVRGTRRVRLSLATNSRPPVKRLGKIRGAVVDALDVAGGTATTADICEALKRSRPRDLKRRVLPMLEEARVVCVDGDTITLAEKWVERLREARELGGELEAERLAHGRHKRKSEAFRRREENASDPHPANVGADGHIQDLRPVEEIQPDQSAAESPVSSLAAAIRRYLDLHPGDACQPPGWIGGTLWAYELHPGKASPGEVRAAIEELGGERYLKDCLQAAKWTAA